MRYNLIILLISVFLSVKYVTAQVFWIETFDGILCAAGSGCDPSIVAWTVTNTGVNSSAANKWYVSARECGNSAGVCGSSCTTDQSLHIGNVSTSSAAFLFCPSGDCGASYDASSSAEISNQRVESPIINCTGQTNITVDFNYIENGEGINDNAELWYFDGVTWSLIVDLSKTSICGSGQGQWTNYTAILPASADNNPNVKIGFRWVNDGNGVGSDPSFAVDDITLTNNSVLPVTWLEFFGEYQKNHIYLSFSTLSEINNDYFEILKSTDGIHFSSIGTVAGNGTTSNPHHYEFLDYELINNSSTYYYKIKQVDFNGSYSFSDIIAVNTVYSMTVIKINQSDYYFHANITKQTYLKFFNIAGQQLYAGYYTDNINLPTINNNVILLQIIEKDGTINNHKLIIK